MVRYDTTTYDVVRLRYDYDVVRLRYDYIRCGTTTCDCSSTTVRLRTTAAWLRYDYVRLPTDYDNGYVRCGTTTIRLRTTAAWLRYDYVRLPTDYDTGYVRCGTTMIRPRTMWCDCRLQYDYGTTKVRLAWLRNDQDTTVETTCPNLKAWIEEKRWNRRGYKILIPLFPTFFLVCSEEEDSLWIELFPMD